MKQRCWACGSACEAPQAAARPNGPAAAFPFKCSWCGALNTASSAAELAPHPNAPCLLLDKPRPARPAQLPYAAGCVLVCIVAAVVGSVFVLGVSLVLPALFSPPALAAFHLPLATLLVFNICYNYAACVARRPGPVQPHLQQAAVDAAGQVQPGTLDGCRYCEACCYYKPAGAHHCSSCGTCVMGLDHHCWYINNCCGAANLRHFLLFLLYLVAGVGYGLAAALALGWRDRRAIAQHTQRVAQGLEHFHPVMKALSFCLFWLLSAPAWLACWAYFTTICVAALAGVGLLFLRQIKLLLRGQSYLESLSTGQHYLQQQQPRQRPAHLAGAGAGLADSRSRRMANVRQVFGAGHPLTWLLPAWNVPLAAAGDGSAREKAS